MPYPTKLTPQAIEDAAWALFRDGGEDALNMRALASVLAVRPASLYRHIGSREELRRALAERAALDLQAGLLEAARDHAPRAALEAVARSYLEYARAQPHAYALLLAPAGDQPPGLKTGAGKALWNTLLALVGALSGHPDDTDHAVALWTFLHGAASLERAGVYGPSGPRQGLSVGLCALLDHVQAAATRVPPS